MTSGEKIMVCMDHGSHGERLIGRGGKLAGLLRCPLYVLSVIPVRSETLDPEREKELAIWRARCQELGATFIVKSRKNRKTAEVIAEAAREHRITQLILGQTGQTRLQEMMHGSLVHELINRVGEVDVHVVCDRSGSAH
ncbi:universal stress protein [Cohnella hongkongensis]|uniref:Universal stress protein n=1 Tax=Cohnella hongkongensis TaxID=178337 RepID=A0ABV9F902_9BACL